MVPKAEKGVTIEEQGEKWAASKREEILLRPPSEAIRVVSQEVIDNVFPLPPLAEGDNRQYTVRFSPFTGEIRVPIWREVPVSEDNGRRFLVDVDSERFAQLRRPREHQVDFENLPDRKVVRLVYARTDRLEAAIRQQVDIMDAYGGEGREGKQIEGVMEVIGFQLEATLGGRLTRDSLSSLASQTAEFLESSELLGAKKEAKKRIAAALIKAAQPDSLGRVNSLATKVRIRSAYLRAVGEEMLAVLVLEKFGSFLGILLMERGVTRQLIQDAAEALDTMVGITRRGAAVFEQTRPKYSQAELQGMEAVLREIAKSLARVRVLPYLREARVAAINLFGCRKKKRDLNREIIGPQADKLFFLPPVVELIQIGYFPDAKERIINGSYNPLMQVFEENKEIGVEIS